MSAAVSERHAWMRVLALARWDDLAPRARPHLDGGHILLRPAETGMIMLRGRIGGTGGPFNVGEATVTRCAVRTGEGHEGHAYVLGSNAEHAEAAAVIDGLMQDPRRRETLDAAVITPLAALLAERRRVAAAKAAATRVDFFTLVRGEP